VLAELPDTAITERIVPAAHGLLLWPTPIDERHEIAGASWTRHADGWELVFYRSVGADLPDVLMPTLRHEIGWLIPVHAVHAQQGTIVNGNDPLAALVASWLLIAQKLAEAEPTPVEPSIRKAYRRSRRQPPEVRLVRIKPADNTEQSAAAGPSTAGRAKPDHRFWVSGHKRNQAYGPDRTLRKEIDIDPFLRSVDRTIGVSFNDTGVVASTLTRTVFGRRVGHGSAERGESARHRGARGPQDRQRPGH
jgi:hypothetical protein